MINYEKVKDANLRDLISEDEYRNYCKHVPISRRCHTIKEFCEHLDNWVFHRSLNVEMVDEVVIPYLIKTGALIPSMQDPISYACLDVPRLHHRSKGYYNDDKEFVEGVHPDEDWRLLTVQRIRDIYFDEDGKFRLSEAREKSSRNKQNILKLYNYMQKCSDSKEKDIEKIGQYLIDNNIFQDEESAEG